MHDRWDGLPLAWRVVAVAIAVHAFLIVMHGVNKELLGDRRYLALDGESNLPTWVSIVTFALAATTAALVAFADDVRRWWWASLAVVMASLSLDEASMAHDALEDMADRKYSQLGWQPLLGLVVLWLYVQLIRRVGPRARLMLILSFSCLVAAQFSSSFNSLVKPPYVINIFLQTTEEWGEMLVATFALAAGVDELKDRVRFNR